MRLRIGLFILVLSAAAAGVISLGQRPADAWDIGPVEPGRQAIAVGSEHTCVLDAGGRVYCVGNNDFGQLGQGTTGTSALTLGAPVAGLTNVVQIAAGNFHTCAVKSDGRIWCWGWNLGGALGDGTTIGRSTPVQAGNIINARSVSVGIAHTCAVLANGTSACWGANGVGQLGTTSYNTCLGSPCSTAPLNVTDVSNVRNVAAGGAHTCWHMTGGSVKCAGSNLDGQLGNGMTTDSMTPLPVSGLGTNATGITAGRAHACATIADGTARCWGDNRHGELGDGQACGIVCRTPVTVLSLGTVSSISAGYYHTCALLADGNPRCWGENYAGQLGDGQACGIVECTTPIVVQHGGVNNFAMVEAGTHHNCGLRRSGRVQCWGWNSGSTGQLGNGTSTDSTVPVDMLNMSFGGSSGITAGKDHTCAGLSNGAVKCWGMNFFGQLGDGTNMNRPNPTDIPALSSVGHMDGGSFHTCALVYDGDVKCTGRDSSGQLGNGMPLTDSNVHVATSALSEPALQVANGVDHTCALIAGGEVQCWGENGDGQLGNNSTTDSPAPVNVSFTTDAMAIATGGRHSCVLYPGGSIACWGDNTYKQLGDGTTIDRDEPGPVLGLSDDVIAISAGAFHTCALLVTGNMECWGNNSFGQIGDGQACGIVSCDPAQSGTLDDIIAIDAGGAEFERSHTCAIVVGGDVHCWGNNDYGQVGDGTNTQRTTPVLVSLADDATQVALGGTHTCAMLSSGRSVCWGHNDRGQLGNGTTTDSNVPVSNNLDTDADGCADLNEAQTAVGSQLSGGLRSLGNPNDYFNPSGDGLNRVDDILLVVQAYFDDDDDANPGLPPYEAGYNPDTDRVLPPNSPYAWSLQGGNGLQRVDDILNSVKQYFHDCV